MTPDEIRAIRKRFGLTAQDFGILIGFKDGGAGRTVRRLEAGDIEVSGTLEKLLGYMLRDPKIPKARPRD
jgi:DNA-binding transcriptional regulator YiaG